MKIKSMPEMERPLEKAMNRGVGALSNAELFALIIKTGTREKSAIHLAEELLGLTEEGIRGLALCGPEELMKIGGVGKSKACAVLAAFEIGKRAGTAPSSQDNIIRTPEDAAFCVMEELRYEKKEHFRSILLDAKGRIISVDRVSIGGLTSTSAHPREVFSGAVRRCASSIILTHNHPSGDPTPSEEDLKTTARLMEAGEILGIKIIDHIIIGDGIYISMSNMGLI